MEQHGTTYTTYVSSLSDLLILNLDEVPSRLVSPVLANFPWYSAAICTSDDFTEVADEAFQVCKSH